MDKIVTAVLIVIAIYVGIAIIGDIDFSGMSIREAKFVGSVCLGVAVSIVSVTKGVNIIWSALMGLIIGAIAYAFILYAMGYIGV